MNWDKYLNIKRKKFHSKEQFMPENQVEAKQALALGVIDIGQYVEFSLTTEPLLDILHDPNPDIRKEAIRKIAEQNTPFSIKMLHNMLNDPDEEVRLYSAQELDRLEAEKQKKIHKLRKELERDKNNPDLKFELAITYIEYAQKLLLSENLRSFFLNKAIELIDENIKLNPLNASYIFNRGLAYQLLKDYNKALVDLKRTVKIDKKYTIAYITMAEIYFYLKRYDYVKQIMNVLPVKKQEIEEIYAQLFWKTEHSHN